MSDPPAPPLRTWRPMALLSLALVLLLLAVWLLAPLALLHYHAWRHRSGRDMTDGRSLAWVADYAVVHRLSREAVVTLLGEPSTYSTHDNLVYFDGVVMGGIRHADGRLVPAFVGPHAVINLNEGHAVAVRRVAEQPCPDGSAALAKIREDAAKANPEEAKP